MRTFSITTAVLFLGVATFGLVASTFAQESAETSQVWLPVFGPGEPARNGDMNASGDLDVTDVIRLEHALFNGGRKPVSPFCLPEGTRPATPISQLLASGAPFVPDTKNGDTNGDGDVDISDVIGLVNFLYLGGAEPTEFHCVPNF